MPDTITEQLTANEVAAVCRGVFQETKQWQSGRQPSSALVSPAAAVGALGELSPGGALMRGFQEQSLARECLTNHQMDQFEVFCFVELVPDDIEKEVRHLYLALCELLSHFWRCFPTTTQQQEQKAVKMHDALHRFHAVKLKPFEVRNAID